MAFDEPGRRVITARAFTASYLSNSIVFAFALTSLPWMSYQTIAL
jgi:hypothetical protein